MFHLQRKQQPAPRPARPLPRVLFYVARSGEATAECQQVVVGHGLHFVRDGLELRLCPFAKVGAHLIGCEVLQEDGYR